MLQPCEPVHFGHVFVKEQLSSACHHQTNEFTLSRPRDFISALTKDRESRPGDSTQTTSPPAEEDPTAAQGDQSAARLGAQPEDQSSSSCSSAAVRPFTPTVTFDCGTAKLGSSSSAGRSEARETLPNIEEMEKKDW